MANRNNNYKMLSSANMSMDFVSSKSNVFAKKRSVQVHNLQQKNATDDYKQPAFQRINSQSLTRNQNKKI